MDCRSAVDMARAELDRHGLRQVYVSLTHRASRRFGAAIHRYGQPWELRLSAKLVVLNEEAQVRDVILHEVAHLLAGHAAGHGPRWQEVCRRIGARPERCYDAAVVARPPAPLALVCPGCHRRQDVYRRSRRVSRRQACAECCDRHANGRFGARFELQLVANRA